MEAEASELANKLDGEGYAHKGSSEDLDAGGVGANEVELLEDVVAMDVADEGTMDHLAGDH